MDSSSNHEALQQTSDSSSIKERCRHMCMVLYKTFHSKDCIKTWLNPLWKLQNCSIVNSMFHYKTNHYYMYMLICREDFISDI